MRACAFTIFQKARMMATSQCRRISQQLDYCQSLTPLEKLIRNLKNQPMNGDSRVEFNFVKTKLKDIALIAFYSYLPNFLPLNISRAELSALRNLSKKKDLVIVRPYKGNGVVILNKIDYINKVELLLTDTKKFILLDVDILDLSIKREGQLIRFLRDTLLKHRSISETVYNNRFPQDSKPGILYGLTKVHKVNCPVRPIQQLGHLIISLLNFWFLSCNLLLVISIPSTVLCHL